MKIFRAGDVPAHFADPKSFVGLAQTKRLAEADDGTPVVVYRVTFEAGSRTNWHTHSGAQWLMILEGRIRIQRWGDPLHEVGAGDAIVIAPGEKHWHGAAPDTPGIHLAINIDARTDWLEAVSDDQYNGR
jgi:quercetin dioxygenase-like cupin family protein